MAAAPGPLRLGRCARAAARVLLWRRARGSHGVYLAVKTHATDGFQAHVAYNRDTHDPETRSDLASRCDV